MPSSKYDPNYIRVKSYVLVGQKVVIYNDKNELLVMQRSDKSGGGGKWSFIGGALEQGEDPYESIQREIEEEAEIRVSALKPFYLWSRTTGDGDFVMMIAYKCTALTTEVTLNWEHNDYKWVSLEEALRLDLTNDSRQILNNMSN